MLSRGRIYLWKFGLERLYVFYPVCNRYTCWCKGCDDWDEPVIMRLINMMVKQRLPEQIEIVISMEMITKIKTLKDNY